MNDDKPVTVLRCAICKKPFSYVPTPTDLCPPGTKNQICDECAEEYRAESWPEEQRQ